MFIYTVIGSMVYWGFSAECIATKEPSKQSASHLMYLVLITIRYHDATSGKS